MLIFLKHKKHTMREDTLLQQAISAARVGRELTARDIFLEVVEINPRNEIAWMWLTGLLDDLNDCIYACEMVLDINPHNVHARQYLSQLQVKKQKQVDEARQDREEQVRQAYELAKSNQREAALSIVRDLAQRNDASAESWRLLADLTPEMDERLHALEKLLALAPANIKVRQQLDRLQHFKNNPLDLGAMYEEQGNVDKAIETYKLASYRPDFKNKWNNIYWKIVGLENLRQEKIAHISPAVSVARLTGGPPLLYFIFLLLHEGINLLTNPEPLLWFGFFWVLFGGFMIAIASVRSHSRLWSLLFKEVASGGTPAARFTMAAAGWILVILPFILLFLMAFNRLKEFLFFS